MPRFKCPKCSFTTARSHRLPSHATSKHGIPRHGKSMERFRKMCKALNARGVRTTSRKRVSRLLGKFARSKTHIGIANTILKAHSIIVEDKQNSAKTINLKDEPAPPVKLAEGFVRQRLQNIRHAGLVSRFDKLCQIASVYENSEKSCRNRSAASTKAYAHMQHRFIQWAKKENPGFQSEISILCCPDLPFDFGHLLQRTFKPFTVKNHASAMCSLIEGILCNNEVKSKIGFKPHMKDALKSAYESWNKIKCLHQRQGRAQQRQKTRSGKFKNAPVLWILEFLMKSEPQCIDFLKDPQSHANERAARELLICVNATYMSLHGQRLCSVLNLTQEELLNAICVHGRYILRIQKHKSVRHHGPSALALRSHQFELLQGMADLYGGENGLVFPIHQTGRACKQLFRPLNEYMKKKCSESPEMSFNLIRKTLETNSFLVEGCNDKARENINTYLCHGKAVTALHYAFKTDQQVISQARIVEAVFANLAALDLVRDKKVPLPGPQGKNTECAIILFFFHFLLLFFTFYAIYLIFILHFLGTFPTREQLFAELRKKCNSKDVSFACTGNESLFQCIVTFWRDEHRGNFIEDLIQKIRSRNGNERPKKMEKHIERVITALPEPWKHEAGELKRLLYEKLQTA